MTDAKQIDSSLIKLSHRNLKESLRRQPLFQHQRASKIRCLHQQTAERWLCLYLIAHSLLGTRINLSSLSINIHHLENPTITSCLGLKWELCHQILSSFSNVSALATTSIDVAKVHAFIYSSSQPEVYMYRASAIVCLQFIVPTPAMLS